MWNILTKSLSAVILALVLLSSVLYIKNNSLSNDISSMEHSLLEKEREIGILSQEVYVLKEANRANEEALANREAHAKELDTVKDTTYEELRKVNRNDKNEKATTAVLSSPLDSNIVRVLDELCERVRGGSCPTAN